MSNLREKALELLENNKKINFNKHDINELVHELNVYHIELELQNQELREKEAQLIQSQDELNFLFMNAPIAYVVLDKNYCVNRYNQKAFEIFGFKTNKKNTYLYSFFQNMSKIEEFMYWIEENSNEDFEIEILDINYQVKWICLSHVQTVYSNENIHLFSIKDISQEKEENEKLKIFNTVLEQLPVSVLITDKKGKITYVNKELLSHTGYSYYELIGNKPSLLKSGYTSKKEYARLWDTISNGKTWRGLFKNLTKNEKSHWMASSITPIFDEKNEITHYISIETNIDEKIKMEEELKAQEDIMLIQARHAAMGEMISIIAHQWRQPLSVITSASTGMKFQKEFGEISKEDELKALNSINDSAQYLSETINDFKNYFKSDKILDSINIMDILKKVEKLNSKILKNNNIKLTVKDSSEITIFTYTNELLQVLINLINNAKDILIEKKEDIKTPEITIEVKDKDDFLFIKVNDNAGGIPENIINEIFDPYFTTKGPGSGTGLGLYITRTIIDKHLRGTITAQNNQKGALFIIKIPNLKY